MRRAASSFSLCLHHLHRCVPFSTGSKREKVKYGCKKHHSERYTRSSSSSVFFGRQWRWGRLYRIVSEYAERIAGRRARTGQLYRLHEHFLLLLRLEVSLVKEQLVDDHLQCPDCFLFWRQYLDQLFALSPPLRKAPAYSTPAEIILCCWIDEDEQVADDIRHVSRSYLELRDSGLHVLGSNLLLLHQVGQNVCDLLFLFLQAQLVRKIHGRTNCYLALDKTV
mmetsp:Transcript_4991/g.12531  ORF Transcript_4991/g.12531 Transcript_4991/m.12531 type:complete len:223 (+) Transcript_4991:463-1131(+)